jgi:hypothetical protein
MVHWKNAAKKFVVSSMVLGTALLLNACGVVDSGSSSGGSGSSGGGSGGSGGGSGGSGGGTTATFLVYTVEGGGLYLVDPANPTQPIKITDKAVKILNEGFVATLSYSNMQYKDFHVDAIYYVEGDKGPLMKLSLVKGSSTPKPVQVSKLTDVCNVLHVGGLVEPNVMLVETVGNDGICETSSDNGKYIVRTDMDSNSEPINVTGKDVVTFVYSDDDKVKGAIIKDSNILKYCNVDLSNCNTLANVVYVSDIGSDNQNQKEYLCVDGKIGIFYQSQNSLSLTKADCNNHVVDDKGRAYNMHYMDDIRYIYYTDDKDRNIKRLDKNNVEKGWQTIYSGGDIEDIGEKTQNYLIAETTDGKLIAVKKDGSSTITIANDSNYYAYIPTPNRLYFTKYTQDSKGNYIVNACYWDDGANSPICDAKGTAWIGGSYAVDGTLNYSSYFTVYKLLKVEGSNGLAGGTLYAVDPSKLDSRINLGNIPSNFSVYYGSGIGDNILLLGSENISNDKFQSDVFFANLSTQNSLKNITNTPDKNEKPSYMKTLFFNLLFYNL